MKRLLAITCTFILMMHIGQFAFAQTPRTLSYQGILTDSTDHPKPDGTYTITFRLYDTESGGTALWTEAKSLGVKKGLFATDLGDVTPFPAAVKFDKPYWLSMQVSGGSELSPRLHFSSVAYSMTSVKADSTRIASTVVNGSITNTKLADASVTSAKIADASIQCADLAQNGASEGQVLKWTSGAWTAAADVTGGGSSGGGWTDNGGVIGLTTATDTVALNTSLRLGKLNVGGGIGLPGNAGINFGSTALHLGSAGTNLHAVAESFTFARDGDASWVRLDNVNKEMGIGTVVMDDRLHVKNDQTSPCWLRVESAHPTQWGQAGLRIKTPQNMWNLRMDLHTNVNLPNGALSLHSQDTNREVMTWLEDGRVGVGTKSPIRNLHVNGSAEVEDTLYAGTVNAGKIVNGPGMANSKLTSHALHNDRYYALDSVTIQAPGPGNILLLFSGYLYEDHVHGNNSGATFHISTTHDHTGSVGAMNWGVSNLAESGRYLSPVVVHGLARVSSAAAYEYFVLGVNYDDPSTLSRGSFTALFIPASYGTVETAPMELPLPDDSAGRTQRVPTMKEPLEGRVAHLTSRMDAMAVELKAVKDLLSSGHR